MGTVLRVFLRVVLVLLRHSQIVSRDLKYVIKTCPSAAIFQNGAQI